GQSLTEVGQDERTRHDGPYCTRVLRARTGRPFLSPRPDCSARRAPIVGQVPRFRARFGVASDSHIVRADWAPVLTGKARRPSGSRPASCERVVSQGLTPMTTRRVLTSLLGLLLLGVTTAAHAAPFAWVTTSFTDSVSVVDLATNSVVGMPIAVGDSPFGVAVHPSGALVYVANYGSDSVSVIDATTRMVIATVPVLDAPFGLAAHPDGSRVYVAHQFADAVTVIDTATNTVLGTIPVGSRPLGLAVNPAGTRLYVTNQGSASVSVIDTGTNTVLTTVTVDNGPFGVAVNTAGTRVYVTNSSSQTLSVIDAATNAVIALVNGPSFSFPQGVVVHPNGARVYVTNASNGRISVVDTATNAVVASPFAAFGLFGIDVSAAGDHVYAASEDNNALYLLDTVTNTVTSSVFVGDGPAAFGRFVAGEAYGGSCDTSDLEAQLAAAQSALQTCQGNLSTANANYSQC